MNTLFPVAIFWYIKLLNMMNDEINDEKSKGRTQSLKLSILAFWWWGGGGGGTSGVVGKGYLV